MVANTNRVSTEFHSEVKLISNVHHRNLVRLLGCSTKGPDLLLVYEYMANSSLDKFLYEYFINNQPLGGLLLLLPQKISNKIVGEVKSKDDGLMRKILVELEQLLIHANIPKTKRVPKVEIGTRATDADMDEWLQYC